MLVGIVSDTHDNADLTEAAVDFFAGRADAVVHCGDFVAPFSAAAFGGHGFDFYAVRGNNDGEWALESTVEGFGDYLGEAGELTFDGREAAVYHGTAGPLVDALVDCGRYDYVFHGHTHERGVEQRGGTTRVNPGGLPLPGDDGPFTVATLETATDDVEFHELP